MSKDDFQNTGQNDPVEDNDPFSSTNAPYINYIMQARIYDVLMGLLTDANPEMAKDLLEMHAEGHLMGPYPAFDGVFITNELNDDEPDR